MHRHSGSVLIVTLWTLTLLAILVTALAGQTRLGARIAMYHQQDIQRWADTLATVNQAEMELALERQPLPVFDASGQDPARLEDNRLYRFNGDEIDLYYPRPDGMRVRIYDHAGKINLREISPPRLRALLEKQLGADADEQIESMLAAWADWRDLSDGVSVGGAEKAYYANRPLPYEPRNGMLQTPDEILHIRGFGEVFAGMDLAAAFTVHGGNDELVNLNLATVEAMRLLPGLDEALIERIVAWRRIEPFRGNGDVARLIPEQNMAALRPWLNSRKITDVYTIMVYPAREDAVADADGGDLAGPAPNAPAPTAYAEVVEVQGNARRPRVLRINPYAPLPVAPEPQDLAAGRPAPALR